MNGEVPFPKDITSHITIPKLQTSYCIIRKVEEIDIEGG